MGKKVKDFVPYDYQDFGIQHILNNDESGLFLDMGLGKTVISLTAFNTMLFDTFEVSKPLIVAPKKVVEHTWLEEIGKWKHLQHLRLARIMGNERQRIEAFQSKADIYIISRDNIEWLVTYLQGAWPFDALILDELSSFKNPSSRRFKAVRIIRPRVKKVVGLTGTPSPNGMEDLWAQLFLLDQGKRLGETFPSYRAKYFHKENDYSPHSKYVIHKGDEDIGEDYYKNKILSKIGDICISMKKEDYLDLPPRIDIVKKIDLPPKIMQKYKDFERSLVMPIGDENEITAVNATVLIGKLLQFANGAIYDADKNWHVVHDEKLEALAEDVEAANGNPILIGYQYKHDVERILQRFKKMKPVFLKNAKDIDAWNRKEIQILITHAASAGHGLNMQYGGHFMSHYGTGYNLEWYLQFCARLDRQGQEYPVTNSRLIVTGTQDEGALACLEDKTSEQDYVMGAVKAIFRRYKK